MTDLRQEHGRLVGRLKRLLAKLGDNPADPEYLSARVLQTVAELIVVEWRIADPLAAPDEPSWDAVRERLALMTSGGGLVVPR